MECTRLAMTMEVSCKEYLSPLAPAAIVTVTMAVIRHLALGVVPAVMEILETAAMQPRPPAATAATANTDRQLANMDPRPIMLTAAAPAAVTDPCICPTPVDPN